MDMCGRNSNNILKADKSTELVLYPELFSEDPPSLETEIRRGIKELKQRRLKERAEKRKASRSSKTKDPTVTKIFFPSPVKFRGCHHNGNIIIDRELLNPGEHLRLLATPRPKPKAPYARLVRKKIPEASNHIKSLAQPKSYYVKDTVTHHFNHLTLHQVERLNERLKARDYLTISESLKFARQQKRDEKRWIRHREQQAFALKKKIVRLELEYLRDVMERVYHQTRKYFLESQSVPVEDELSIASEVILTRICELIGVEVPQKNSTRFMDQYYWQLGDKAAQWMLKIMQSCGMSFKGPEDVKKRLSAASSLFENPTNPEKQRERAITECNRAYDWEVDEITINVITDILDSCIDATIMLSHDVESCTTYGSNFVGAQSVSQTVVRAAPSEETTKTEREKGSKVNFMPRYSSITVDHNPSEIN